MYPLHPLEYYGETIKTLGKGAYGEVTLVKKGGSTYAVKKMELFDNSDLTAQTIRELAIATKMHHPNVVKVIDVIREHNKVYMVMEYAKGGTLSDVVIRTRASKTYALRVAYQFLVGVAYIHSLDVIHRDLKPPNVLMGEKGVKIADFGLSRALICSYQSGLTEEVFTIWYRPPEVLYGSNRYTLSGDVWSCGCILYYILTGQHLFTGMDELQMIELIEKMFGTPTDSEWKGVSTLPLYHSIHRGGREMIKGHNIIPSKVSEEWYSVIRQMLVMDPAKRSSIYELLQNPIFNSVRQRELELPLSSCISSLDLSLSDVHLINPNFAMRTETLEWILSITLLPHKNPIDFRTFFIAAMIFDKMYDVVKPTNDNSELYGITCLYLASVYNDVYHMHAITLAGATPSLSYVDVIGAAEQLLGRLNYDLMFSTSADFLIEFGKHYSKHVRVMAKAFLYFIVITDAYYALTQDKVALLSLVMACQYYGERFRHIDFLNMETIKKFTMCTDAIRKNINILLKNDNLSFTTLFKKLTNLEFIEVFNTVCSSSILV